MLKKIAIYYLVVVLSVCVLSSCQERKPITVSFYDISGAYSPDHTIKIMFSEEKDYENLYVDILLKSDKDTTLVIFPEFGENKVTLSLTAGKTVSLDEFMLFNLEEEQTESMVGYSDVLTTIIVINSSQNAKLTLQAIVGEKENNQFKQKYIVSQEYTLDVMAKGSN